MCFAISKCLYSRVNKTGRIRNPEAILSILESETHPKRKGIETFIFDDQKRTLTATFVTHSVINGDDDIIYRLLYKVKLSPVQAVIR